ncbi:MAG: PD-(D/E)XK nuclease family protein [Bacillaceae bacterium]|nr:PD-(D/E)XK nuclease family protein [Bacillaceae bacterium]
MVWEHYRTLSLPFESQAKPKRKYSITADILSYQRCPIQYGAFSTRKYEPSLSLELFYGDIIHQVLDQAHAHYNGKFDPSLRGTYPTDEDIERYFDEVENSLKARGLRATDKVRDKALNILKKFNEIEGPNLYNRILDTECKLQADRADYILHGNVDVLAVSEDDETEVEIWDYKGTDKPSINQPEYKQYEFQMQVYAELYRRKKGKPPKKAVLYFLNELDHVESNYRPQNAIMEVELNPSEVEVAMSNFDKTVGEIESCRDNNTWSYPETDPSEKTCDACDLRWNCQAAKNFGRNYRLIYP